MNCELTSRTGREIQHLQNTTISKYMARNKSSNCLSTDIPEVRVIVIVPFMK